MRPETAPETIFVGFSCRFRSESLSGPIFGGSDPAKSCYFLGGSTILTKSPFSKKHRKRNVRGPVLGPQMATNRRRGDPKSSKIAKKVDCLGSVFLTFFCMRKKTKKIEKRASVPPWTERVGGLAEAAGKVRKGNPSGTGDLTHPSRTTPAPRWGTANLTRCARPPPLQLEGRATGVKHRR